MSNEIHLGIIEERKKLYPDRGDRSPHLTEWLESRKRLIEAMPEGLDAIVKYQAERFNRALNSPIQVGLARRDQVVHRMLKEVLRNLRSGDKQDDREIINNLPDFAITWILDVATGQCVEPKSVGRNKNLSRDFQISQMVVSVHDTMKLPYESDERYSACHEVADCLDMKYGKVRTIWRKMRYIDRSILD